MSFNFSQTAGTSGETSIVIAATSTTDIEDRIENYTIANNSGNSVVMSIMQKAYVPTEKYINLYPSSITWDGSGGTASLQIQSNDDWVLTSDNWINLSRNGEIDRGFEAPNTLSGNGNTIIGISAKENTGTTRTGTIVVRCSSDSATSATTTVVQNAYIKPYIELSYYSINCDSTGTTSSFTISSNVDWYIVVDESWASVNTESGSGNANITFTVDENTSSIARSCYITVYARSYGIKVSLAINQDATQLKPYITLSPDSFVVSDKGSTGNTIHVSANCSYDITTETDWITLHSSSGSGDGTVTFDTDPAPLVKFNTGLIEFSNSALSRTVTVERQGEKPYLSASTSTISFDLQSATSLVNVYSNVSWGVIIDIDENKPWLTVSPSSGSGNGTISVNASSATTDRACDIAVYNKEYGLFWGIKIVQRSGKFIYYDMDYSSYWPTGLSFDPRQNIFDYGNAVYVGSDYNKDTGVGYWEFDRNVTELNIRTGNSSYRNFKNIYFPYSVKSFGNGAFSGNCSIIDLVIPESTTGIGTSCFAVYNPSQQPTFPTKSFLLNESLKTIGNNAFMNRDMSGCTLDLPNTITSIGQSSFSHCHLEGDLVIPRTVTYIRNFCFSSNNFKSVNTGEGVRTIGNYAFSYNTSLNILTLGSKVNSIGNYAFNGCSGLTEIYSYSITAPTLEGTDVFYGVPSIGVVHYPAGADYSSWQSSSYPNYYLSNWNFIGDL